MLTLGIGGLLHDGAAALLKKGKLIAAVEEEKLLRQPHPGGLPDEAIQSCLAMAGAKPEDLACVALARPLGAGGDPSFHLQIKTRFPKSRIVIVDHHTAHAASAFFPSDFEKATVVTLDRVGDLRSGAVWEADGTRIELQREIYAPDAPAAFYSRVTELLGFRPGAQEHLLQWLSLRGTPRYCDKFADILGSGDESLPRIDHSYFDASRTMGGGFSDKFFSHLGIDAAGDLSEDQRADLAASVQRTVEQVVLGMIGTGEDLCLAGGLALNALLVAALEQSGQYKNVWVQPAAGNSGNAIGCAYYAWHHVLRQPDRFPLENLFLGPEYDREHIKLVLENCKLRFQYLMTGHEVVQTAVSRLADNQIVAWFQGRAEFGPRALGNRSILASPLNAYSTENLNVYIKRREPFRKFAASVPEELASEYFDCGANSRSLATVSRVREAHRKTFEAALLDGERIRVHSVRKQDNPLYWELLHAAGQSSGLPVLYNTSFNLFGEPLVCDPRAAVRSFYASGIDAMFVGNFLLEK